MKPYLEHVIMQACDTLRRKYGFSIQLCSLLFHRLVGMNICIRTYIFHNVIQYWRSRQFRIHLLLSSVLEDSSRTDIRFICLNSLNFPQNLQKSSWLWQTWHNAFVTHTDTRLMSYESQDCWRITLCTKGYPTLWAFE